MNITRKNRRDAYNAVIPKVQRRKDMIKYVLASSEDGMTAEEILSKLVASGMISYEDNNFVRPRLTEMKADGEVCVVGRRPSRKTGKNTSVWKLTVKQ